MFRFGKPFARSSFYWLKLHVNGNFLPCFSVPKKSCSLFGLHFFFSLDLFTFLFHIWQLSCINFMLLFEYSSWKCFLYSEKSKSFRKIERTINAQMRNLHCWIQTVNLTWLRSSLLNMQHFSWNFRLNFHKCYIETDFATVLVLVLAFKNGMKNWILGFFENARNITTNWILFIG